jgi:hypothetical protein
MGGFHRLWHLIYHQSYASDVLASLPSKGRILVESIYTIYMDTKQRIIRTSVAWAALLLFMTLSHPQHLPVFLLIVPFVLLFWALISLWGLVVPFLRRLVGKRGYSGSRRLRFTVCGSLVLLIILQSLGQLTVRDVGTIAAIAVIGYLYIGRSRSTDTK